MWAGAHIDAHGCAAPAGASANDATHPRFSGPLSAVAAMAVLACHRARRDIGMETTPRSTGLALDPHIITPRL